MPGYPCCCGCPCTADALRAAQNWQPSLTMTTSDPKFSNDTLVFTGYSGCWQFEITDVWSAGVDYMHQVALTLCCDENKWNASGRLEVVIYQDGDEQYFCYYVFDQDICPIPPPRVNSCGHFHGAFTINQFLAKQLIDEQCTGCVPVSPDDDVCDPGRTPMRRLVHIGGIAGVNGTHILTYSGAGEWSVDVGDCHISITFVSVPPNMTMIGRITSIATPATKWRQFNYAWFAPDATVDCFNAKPGPLGYWDGQTTSDPASYVGATLQDLGCLTLLDPIAFEFNTEAEELTAIIAATTEGGDPIGEYTNAETIVYTVQFRRNSADCDVLMWDNGTVDWVDWDGTGFLAGSGANPDAVAYTVTVVKVSGSKYEITVTGFLTGHVDVGWILDLTGALSADVVYATDTTEIGVLAGTPNCAATTPAITFDNAIPNAVFTNTNDPVGGPTNSETLTWTVYFRQWDHATEGYLADPVTDFDKTKITWDHDPGAEQVTVTGSGANYTITVTGLTGTGQLSPGIAAGACHDRAGNDCAATAVGAECEYDYERPTVSIVKPIGQDSPTYGTVEFTVTFSETVTGFATGDVNFSDSTGITGTLVGEVAGSGTDYTVAVTGMSGAGDIIAKINANVAQDVVGNLNTASPSSATVAYDDILIDCAITYVSQTETVVTFNVEFTRLGVACSIDGFEDADCTVGGSANPDTATVSGSTGSSFTVDVSGMTAVGSVTLHIDAGKVTRTAAPYNPNSASNTATTSITLRVYGDESPAVSGDYTYGGQLNNYDYYQLTETGPYIFHVPLGYDAGWRISATLGVFDASSFMNEFTLNGLYVNDDGIYVAVVLLDAEMADATLTIADDTCTPDVSGDYARIGVLDTGGVYKCTTKSMFICDYATGLILDLVDITDPNTPAFYGDSSYIGSYSPGNAYATGTPAVTEL